MMFDSKYVLLLSYTVNCRLVMKEYSNTLDPDLNCNYHLEKYSGLYISSGPLRISPSFSTGPVNTDLSSLFEEF